MNHFLDNTHRKDINLLMIKNSFIEEQLLRGYDPQLDISGIRGKRIASRLQRIADIGVTNDMGSCRIGYSEEERQAKELVKKWMIQAGLQVKEDPAGNLIGRQTGIRDELPAILSGSHVDSVPNGGHFDGVLGVLSALEVIEAWKETNYLVCAPGAC